MKSGTTVSEALVLRSIFKELTVTDRLLTLVHGDAMMVTCLADIGVFDLGYGVVRRKKQ